MKKLILAVAIAATFNSHSTSISGRYNILGAGTITCAKFVKEKDTDMKFAYDNWVLGYLTYVSKSETTLHPLVKGLDNETILFMIEQECRNNPTYILFNATEAVGKDLIERANKGIWKAGDE